MILQNSRNSVNSAYKIICILILFSVNTDFLSSRPQETFASMIVCSLGKAKKPDAQNEKKVLELLKKYYLPGYFMIDANRQYYTEYCGRADDSFLNLLSSDQPILKKFSTIVHEKAHSFHSIYWNHSHAKGKTTKSGYPAVLVPSRICQDGNIIWPCDQKHSFYFEDLGVLYSERIQSFPPKTIANSVTVLPLSKGRFEIYIAGIGGEYGQDQGINWMLDEYHAYYHDNSATLALARAGVLPEPNTYYLSYFEFTYFILHYIVYAQTHDSKLYKRIMSSPGFLSVFVTIHDRFEKVNQQMQENPQLKKTFFPKVQNTIAEYQKILSDKPYSSMMKKIRKRSGR